MASCFDRMIKLEGEIDREMRRERQRQVPSFSKFGHYSAMKRRIRAARDRLANI